MDRDETLKIMSVLKAAYSSSYRDVTKSDAQAAVSLWQTMLSHYPYETVAAAVKALIATSKWVPTIAEVNAKIQALTQPQALSEMEAWELVRKALSNSGYESRKEFERLPTILQKCVGSPNQLKEWAMMDISTVQSVIQSNFMRTYRAKVVVEQEYNMLPETVRSMLGGVAAQMKSLPNGVVI